MNMEKINAARAELTEQAQKEKRTELANFIEEHINSMLTTEDAADKVKGKTLNDCISQNRRRLLRADKGRSAKSGKRGRQGKCIRSVLGGAS